MMNNHEAISTIGDLSMAEKSPLHSSVTLFSGRIKSAWIAVMLLTCLAELVSIPPMPFLLFYFCYAIKVGLFFSLGFLAPLAFHRLNGIGLGFVLSMVSAILTEVLQNLSHNGHSFHWHELAGKLSLIALGFALALEPRYQKKISLGPVEIGFLTHRFQPLRMPYSLRSFR